MKMRSSAMLYAKPKYYSIQLIENNKVSSSLRLLTFRFLDKPMPEPKPPQFILLWVPGFEAIPMSIAGYRGGEIDILVKPVGPTTMKLAGSKPGEYYGVIGPLGKGLVPKGERILFIAGGSGIAPILRYLEYYDCSRMECHVIHGCWGKGEIGGLPRIIAGKGGIPYTACLDGCVFKGTVIDALDHFDTSKYDAIIVSGPIEMEKLVAKKIPDLSSTYFIMESHVKCGIGLCGKCRINGVILCVQGPGFPYNIVKGVLD